MLDQRHNPHITDIVKTRCLSYAISMFLHGHLGTNQKASKLPWELGKAGRHPFSHSVWIVSVFEKDDGG